MHSSEDLTKIDSKLKDEFLDLCDAVIDHQADGRQIKQLESLALEHPALMRLYVELMNQNAQLLWSDGTGSHPAAIPHQDESVSNFIIPSTIHQEFPEDANLKPQSWKKRLLRSESLPYIVSSCFMLLVGLFLGMWTISQTSDSRAGGSYAAGTRSTSAFIATLVQAKGCKWENGILPTKPGTRLEPGSLRLAEGLAYITFDNGAEVVLEAPAELILESSSSAILSSGRLKAHVPSKAVGFTVNTKLASVIDLGTDFGMHSDLSGQTYVQVFTGVVNVHHRSSGDVKRITEGMMVRVTQEGIAFLKGIETGETSIQEKSIKEETDTEEMMIITTGDGAGKDTYIHSNTPARYGDPSLYGKATTLACKTSHKFGGWERRIYLGFDVSRLRGKTIKDARLSLAISPTGLGFASGVPDAEFIVYGITDQTADDWNESKIEWGSAPGNKPGKDFVDSTKTVEIGRFHIDQGVRHGSRSISTEKLAEFLNQDTNGIVSFILVRKTDESASGSLVHGFASREHPTLEPPSLRIVLSDKD